MQICKIMSGLYMLNIFLQIFFIRIGYVVKENKKVYGIFYFILPFTGWFSNYIVLTKEMKYKFF